MAKLSPTRRLLLLANLFNLLAAVYFIIIAICGLTQLRWYHQLTVAVKARYFITLATSYFAFLLLILVGLILMGLFAGSTLTLAKTGHNKSQDSMLVSVEGHHDDQPIADAGGGQQQTSGQGERGKAVPGGGSSPQPHVRITLRQTSISSESHASACCSIVFHTIASIGLVVILIIWLYNTGELVRDSISNHLDYGLARYQFTNRTNYLTVAIDGIQEINACCGSLDYTDFPRQRANGLSPSHYPGSCCGKHVFAAQARTICMADEVVRSRRTNGCTTVLANHYDLISLLVVPVALVCLFVNITIIALVAIARGAGPDPSRAETVAEQQHRVGSSAARVGRNRRRPQKL